MKHYDVSPSKTVTSTVKIEGVEAENEQEAIQKAGEKAEQEDLWKASPYVQIDMIYCTLDPVDEDLERQNEELEDNHE